MLFRLVVALFLAIILWSGLFAKTASSQLIESRLNNLEANFNRLESRLANLEAQTIRTPPTPGRTVPTLPSTPARRTDTINRVSTQSQRDQMFDRLATLVVETKQQVNRLEQRVKKLEAR